MAEQPSRFAPSAKTTHERLSTNTVGLVALSDFRKRRAEVLEQQEREAREAHLGSSATNTPDRSLTATPNNVSDSSETEVQVKRKKKQRKLQGKAGPTKLSFGGDDDEEDVQDSANSLRSVPEGKAGSKNSDKDGSAGDDAAPKKLSGMAANASVGIVPRAMTKAALRKEAAEREALRKEFLVLQAAVKATEIAIPFVFYDGTNTPGGMVRVKKGDFVWVFLDKSRKVGAELGVGGDKNANARREWARVNVDDLMLVRDGIIIPHHYEFYFFIMNKTMGPGGRRLFDYLAESPPSTREADAPHDPLSTAATKKVASIESLEGASVEPSLTKVVDRRWYERNKHIYPASTWQEFDPEKDYQNQVRRDPGGNAFFFSK